MSRISDAKKEEIRDAADIVDIVSDYVKLKKAGSSFTGLCPFHNEKTPSFNVTPRLGIYKCFGCGAGGDAFKFIMEMEGVGFVEAMRTLAGRYNIELPEEDNSEEFDERTQLTEGVYHALRFAGVYYYQQLTGEEEAEDARGYLNKRGLNRETIKTWGLGFAPDAMDQFYKHALAKGINERYLHEAGLIKYSEQGNRPYDAFRGRLMFPIFNPSGKVIGFGGRILGDKKGPKYLNSPQTIVYNKSEVIYGIHSARNQIRRADQSILVEGYMDVLSLWQHGIKNVVATSGTALTPEQMRRLRNYSQNLLMVYDADNAGQNAMMRGLDIALEQDMHVRLMHLPDGEDPDSFVQQFGAESFTDYTEKEARDFVRFMVENAEQSGNWEDPMGRKDVISRILASIARVSDEVLQESLMGHLARISSIREQTLRQEMSRHQQQLQQEKQREADRQRRQQERGQPGGSTAPPQNEAPHPGESPAGSPQTRTRAHARPALAKLPNYEKEIIRLMVQYGDDMIFYVASQINDTYFEAAALKQFFNDIVQRYNEEQDISIRHYASRDAPYPELVGEIFMEKYEVSERGNQRRERKVMRDADPYATAKGALKRISIEHMNRLSETLNEKIHAAGAEEETRRQLYADLTELRRQMARFNRHTADQLFPDPGEVLGE
ncbi:MAG: DNA primase [Cyclonatronaceae bacterium]